MLDKLVHSLHPTEAIAVVSSPLLPLAAAAGASPSPDHGAIDLVLRYGCAAVAPAITLMVAALIKWMHSQSAVRKEVLAAEKERRAKELESDNDKSNDDEAAELRTQAAVLKAQARDERRLADKAGK